MDTQIRWNEPEPDSTTDGTGHGIRQWGFRNDFGSQTTFIRCECGKRLKGYEGHAKHAARAYSN